LLKSKKKETLESIFYGKEGVGGTWGWMGIEILRNAPKTA
jgi:hypothetical protein